ncbi:MAG: hypothetical protein ACM3OC_07030 [Deltaproteobacteria bacterium]
MAGRIRLSLIKAGILPVLRALFFRDHFFLLSRETSCMPRLPGPRRVDVVRAGYPDEWQMRLLAERGEEYWRRFAQGHICFVAKEDDRVIGMEWLKFTRSHYEELDEFSFDLGNQACWSYDGYVEPRSRMKGVWPALKYAELLYSRSAGTGRTFCLVKAANRNAYSSHLRVGYSPRHEVVFIRVLFFRVHISRSLRDGIPCGWNWTFGFGRRDADRSH